MIRERSSIGSRFGVVIFAGAALVVAACGSSSPSTTGKGGSGGGSGGGGGSAGKGGSGGSGGSGGGGSGGQGQGGTGGDGGSGVITCPTTPQFTETTSFGSLFGGWAVSATYSSPGLAPPADADSSGTVASIDQNEGNPVSGSLRLDIPFSAQGQLLLLQHLYNTPENFTDTLVTAQIKILSGVIGDASDSVTAYLTLKSGVGYAYAAGSAVQLDPSAGWQTITIDPDAVAATAAFGYTTCDIRELDIEIHTGTTGTYVPGTILVDTVTVAPKHASDGGTDATVTVDAGTDATTGTDASDDSVSSD